MASMIAGIASMGSTIRLPRVADVDPDLQSDPLPEPYATIDEIVRGLVDAAWGQLRDRALQPSNHTSGITAI